MELNMAMVKAKKHKESREHKMVEDFNTDRDVFKGHSTSFMFEEDKEFAKVFDTTFESREDEEFDRLIDKSFNYRDDTELDEKYGDITRELFTNELGKNKRERLKQEEEFAKIYSTTTFKFQEDDEFHLLFNNISPKLNDDERFTETFDFAKGTFVNKLEEPACKFKQDVDIKVVKCPVLRGGCKQAEFAEFAKNWSRYAESQWETDKRELRQHLMNCVVGPLEIIMYNSLGGKLDTLSEPDLIKELEKLAVVKCIAEQQNVEAVDYVNNTDVVYMKNTAKPTSLKSPVHSSLTQRSPNHSGTKVHSQSFREGNTNEKVLVEQIQEDLAAEDQALAIEVQQVVAAEDQDLAAEDQALAIVQPGVAAEDQILAAEDQVLGTAVQLIMAAEAQTKQDEDRRVHPSKQEDDQAAHAASPAGITIAHRGGGYLLGLQEKTQHH
jgi:hypothetical protein